MEYRKLDAGTKLRYTGDTPQYDDINPSDVLELIKDDGSKMPYYCRNERTGGCAWFYAEDVELVEVSATAQPTKLSPFRKVVTLTSDDGCEFTLENDEISIVQKALNGVVLPFATLVAAVDELRGHTK